MKHNHFLIMFPIIIILLCSMEAAVGEALIKGCVQIVADKVFESDNNYYVPDIVDNNSRTISNYSSYPVTIIHDDEQLVLFPDDSNTFYNENPDRDWADFQASFLYRYNENLVTMEYIGDYWGVTFYDKIIDDEDYNDVDNDEDVTEETEGNIPADTSARVENDLENQSFETRVSVSTPVSNKNVPEFDTIPDKKTAPKNPQTDYTDHISIDEPVTRRTAIAPQQPRPPLPLISNFRQGMYYLQIGSYTNVNAAYSEIAKIDNGLPVAVMKITVKINGIDKEVHRILIGPLDYEKSLLLLRQFSVKYNDAFVWYGR